MASVVKVLGQSAPAATTLTTLYTVPGSTSTAVSTIICCNRGAADITIRVAVRPAGAAIADQHYIYYDIPVYANNAFAATIGLTLAATDVVSVYTSLATASFSLFGEETS